MSASTGGAVNFVALGALKPQLVLNGEYLPVVYRKLASYVIADDTTLEDDATLRRTINSELISNLLDVLDTKIMNGTGTGEDWTGLVLGATGPTTAAGTNDPLMAILGAAGRIHDASGLRPDSLVVNYATALGCAGKKAVTDGPYLAGPPQVDGRPAWAGGFRVATSEAMANGEALLGSYARAAVLVDPECCNSRTARPATCSRGTRRAILAKSASPSAFGSRWRSARSPGCR